MTAPSQMSLRRIPDALHLKVRMSYAAGWESLIETHTRQALEFVCEFAQRLPVLAGLDLFFQVIAVPEAMQESICCRTLISLDLESLPPLTRPPRLTGWRRIRIDRVLENERVRRRYDEKTVELARMVGARVAEAVIATHVENAVDFTRLLKGVMPVNAATDRYLFEFALPESIASMVRQRVRARVAGEELTAHYEELPPQLPEPAAPPAPPAAPSPPPPIPAPPQAAAPPSAARADSPSPEPPRLKILP